MVTRWRWKRCKNVASKKLQTLQAWIQYAGRDENDENDDIEETGSGRCWLLMDIHENQWGVSKRFGQSHEDVVIKWKVETCHFGTLKAWRGTKPERLKERLAKRFQAWQSNELWAARVKCPDD